MIQYTKQKYVQAITDLMIGLNDGLITVKQFIVFSIRLKKDFMNNHSY